MAGKKYLKQQNISISLFILLVLSVFAISAIASDADLTDTQKKLQWWSEARFGMFIHYLVDIASKGGNFLLKVGPTAEGLIPEASVQRLQAIGQWMSKNSESIYGTTASPLGAFDWGRCTAKKPGKLYLHVFNWPGDGQLKVTGLQDTVKKAYLLADSANNSLISKRPATQTLLSACRKKLRTPSTRL